MTIQLAVVALLGLFLVFVALDAIAENGPRR